MATRRQRRIERGLRWHGRGIQAYIRVNGELRTQQFDADIPRAHMRAWLDTQRRQTRRIRRGTLAADVPRYLATIASRSLRINRAGSFAHWLRTPLGSLPRAMITRDQIQAALASFVSEPQPRKERQKGVPVPPRPLAIETANKCLTALRALYRTLNESDDDPNPAAKVRKLRPETKPPWALTYAIAEAILAGMPHRGQAHRGKGHRSTVNKAKLRLTLMLYTGWPPAQIARIQPAEDIQWGPPVLVRLRPRRKGKGVAERWMPVTPKGEDAVRAWLAGDAAGTFARSSVRRTWLRACAAYRRAQVIENVARQARGEPRVPLLADDVVPYDLRHTFIARTLASSGSVAGTQYLAMHADPRQTMHYAAAAIPEEAQRAITAAATAQKSDKDAKS